ncbi:MAG: alpha/beta hydrolase [Rubrivivax sp.]|nr:alpha/beta hydrolase [Rubrivivax sp.]
MNCAVALPGERFTFDGISCFVQGSGAPLLLVHSVNAAASAAEVRPLYDHYGATRTVFAIDLPGYGCSLRSDRAYTPRLMTDALHAVAAQIRQRCGVTRLDALAVSLSCEFLARAASETPAHWGRLALVSPTGFNGRADRRGASGSTRAVPGMLRLLRQPLWEQSLFRALTRPGVVRYFLERTWGGKAIDEPMFRAALVAAAAPGARFAPLHFLAGGLFSADIHNVYDAVRSPVWVSHGIRGDFTDYRGMDRVPACAGWRRSVYPAGALPYFEHPAAFNADFDSFLGAPD